MFELDGDFDLDEDFLQEVFETENEATKNTAGTKTKGEKRSFPGEEPRISTKKYKSSSNDCTSSQFENRVPFESRSKASINNIDNKDAETYAKLNSVHEVSNIKLNAYETRVHSIRNDRCKQSGLRMQLNDTCSTLSDNCSGRSTVAMIEPRVQMHLDRRYRSCGGSTFKESVRCDTAPQRCITTGQAVRQRKFPGPAGLLPDKDQLMNQPTASMPIPDSEILHNENPLCFQSSSSMFEGVAWQQMLRDFELSDNSGPLSQFTVAWVKRRAAARQLLHQKVPFLVTVLRDLDCSSPDPCVILQDRTGEVHGTLHREVWEQYGGQLLPGSVLVLRQVGVLSTGITARRHYLNVTCNNIINIYSNIVQEENDGQHSCKVRTTRVHQVTRAELLKSTCDWQALHSAPETSPDCQPVNSMFSTVGSPASLSVTCCALNRNGNVTGNASPLSSRPNGWQQSAFSVPKLVCGTKVPQTSDRMLWNSDNNRGNTRSGNSLNDNVEIRKTNLQNMADMEKSSHGRMYTSSTENISSPFNRRVMEATAQSVYGRCASSEHNLSGLPQQIKKDEVSNNGSLKFHPQMAHASGRRNILNSLHQNDEGKTYGIKGFKFLPQPSLPDRTDTLAPKFKGGFIPKVSHFGSSSASASKASNPSQVPAIPSASSDVSDFNRTSKLTENVAKPLQQTPTPSASLTFGSASAVINARNLYSSSEDVPRSSKCLTEVESSVLEVLEGLDTSSLFDDF